jgi:hypothetical protein
VLTGSEGAIRFAHSAIPHFRERNGMSLYRYGVLSAVAKLKD